MGIQDLMGRRKWIALWYTSIIWLALYGANGLVMKYTNQDLSNVLAYTVGGFNLLWGAAIIAVGLIYFDSKKEI